MKNYLAAILDMVPLLLIFAVTFGGFVLWSVAVFSCAWGY